jgi:excisionase family DNA binding protein
MYEDYSDSRKAAEVRREYLSYREAEVFSGLSRTTLWRLIGAGEIKAARVGRAVRISRLSLQEFMDRAADNAVGV